MPTSLTFKPAVTPKPLIEALSDGPGSTLPSPTTNLPAGKNVLANKKKIGTVAELGNFFFE